MGGGQQLHRHHRRLASLPARLGGQEERGICTVSLPQRKMGPWAERPSVMLKVVQARGGASVALGVPAAGPQPPPPSSGDLACPSGPCIQTVRRWASWGISYPPSAQPWDATALPPWQLPPEADRAQSLPPSEDALLTSKFLSAARQAPC